VTQDPQHAPWDRPDRSDQPGAAEGSASGAGQQHPDDRSWSSPPPPTSQQPVEPTAASGPPSYGPPSYEQPAHEQPSYGQPGGYAGGYGGGYGGGYAGGPAQPPAGYGYGYGGVPVAPAPPAPVSTIVLLVLSGLATLFTITFLVGLVYVAPVVLSIMALNRHRLDPDGARRLTKTGWIVFAVATGLLVLLLVLLFGALAAGIFSGFADAGTYGSSV